MIFVPFENANDIGDRFHKLLQQTKNSAAVGLGGRG